MERLIKDSTITLISRVTSSFFLALATIIIARMLGPELQGQYFTLTLIPIYLALLGSLEIRTACLYFIGKAKYPLSDIVRNAFTIAILTSIILVVAFIGVTSIFQFSFLRHLNPIFLTFVTLAVPFHLIYDSFSYILLAIGKVKKYNFLLILQPITLLIGVIICLLILKQGIFQVLFVWICAIMITCIVSSIFVRKIADIRFSLNFKILKDFIFYGFQNYILFLFIFLNYRIDIFLINYFLSSDEVGYYSVATKMVEIIFYIPTSIAIVLFPRLASSCEKYSDEITPIVCRQAVFLALIASCFILTFSGPFVSFLFGILYNPSVFPLIILCPGMLLLTVFEILRTNFAARGRPILGAFPAFAGSLVNIVLNLYLIPYHGIIGAAVASTLSYSIVGLASLCIFMKISNKGFFETVFIRFSDFLLYKNIYLYFIGKSVEFKAPE